MKKLDGMLWNREQRARGGVKKIGARKKWKDFKLEQEAKKDEF